LYSEKVHFPFIGLVKEINTTPKVDPKDKRAVMEEKHQKMKEKAGFGPKPSMFGEAPVASLSKP
jgi:hypothetical protein